MNSHYHIRTDVLPHIGFSPGEHPESKLTYTDFPQVSIVGIPRGHGPPCTSVTMQHLKHLSTIIHILIHGHALINSSKPMLIMVMYNNILRHTYAYTHPRSCSCTHKPPPCIHRLMQDHRKSPTYTLSCIFIPQQHPINIIINEGT